MAQKQWFLTRKKGITPTHVDMGEYLFISLYDNCCEKQRVLVDRLLKLCSLEGWQIRKEESRPGYGVITLYIRHNDIMGRKTTAYFEPNETSEFPCEILGMDARESLLAKARNA